MAAQLVLPALLGLAKAGKWIRYQLRFQRKGRRLDAIIETSETRELQKALLKAKDLEAYWDSYPTAERMTLQFDTERGVWVAESGHAYRLVTDAERSPPHPVLAASPIAVLGWLGPGPDAYLTYGLVR